MVNKLWSVDVLVVAETFYFCIDYILRMLFLYICESINGFIGGNVAVLRNVQYETKKKDARKGLTCVDPKHGCLFNIQLEFSRFIGWFGFYWYLNCFCCICSFQLVSIVAHLRSGFTGTDSLLMIPRSIEGRWEQRINDTNFRFEPTCFFELMMNCIESVQ